MTRDRKATLAAAIQAEREAVKTRVPKFDKFEKAEAALRGSGRSSNSQGRRLVDRVEPHQTTVHENSGFNEKVIRDSFTMPSSDYQKIPQLKAKCLKAGLSVTKSELLRAGLHALEELSMKGLREVIQSVEKVKPGRPAET